MNEQPQELEVQTPDSATWYDATLFRTKREKNYIILALSNGTKVLCGAREVSISPAQHVYCLPLGTPCWVRIAEREEGGWCALECQIEGEPITKTETVTVKNWKGYFGSCERPCGCPLFCTLPSRSLLNVHNGDTCTVDIALSNREGRGFVGFVTKILETPQGNGEKHGI
jgi:hypothetical protein